MKIPALIKNAFADISFILILNLLILHSVSSFAADLVLPHPNKILHKLFTTLPGNWDGRAIETPIGPVEYAINFYQCDKNMVAGVAELNVSNHHWQFRLVDDELHLTFLSTFRGNQEPIQLRISKAENNTIRFYAPKLALLTLSVTKIDENIHIRVFHHRKPHVYIRLTPSNKQINKKEPSTKKEKACKLL